MVRQQITYRSREQIARFFEGTDLVEPGIVAGRYTTCAGVTCLGNPGEKTPTLAYGTATGVGPFLCQSATTGVTCTTGGRGFRISDSGIASVPA